MLKRFSAGVVNAEIERLDRHYPERYIQKTAAFPDGYELVAFNTQNDKYYKFIGTGWDRTSIPSWWNIQLSPFPQDEFSEDQISAAIELIEG